MSTGFLSIAETAARTGVSTDHIRRHAPIVRIGRRTLVPESWLDELAQPAAPSAAPTPRKAAKAATGRVFEF